MSASTPKLFAALAEAQRKARAVKLDSRNEFHRYDYASAEGVIDEGRLALSSAGLSLSALDVRLDRRELPRVVRSKNAGSHEMGPYEVVVVVTFLLSHESGESLPFSREWPAVEEAGRPLDKAVAAATTNCLSYAIRDLLLIPRDNDLASMDRRDDRDFGAPAAAKPEERREPEREPERREEPRREEQPRAASDPSSPAETYDTVLAALHERGRAGKIDASDSQRIRALSIPSEGRLVLEYVARAWRAESPREISAIGAEIRKELGHSPAHKEVALDEIRPAWDAMEERAREAKGRAA